MTMPAARPIRAAPTCCSFTSAVCMFPHGSGSAYSPKRARTAACMKHTLQQSVSLCEMRCTRCACNDCSDCKACKEEGHEHHHHHHHDHEHGQEHG
jgi:hypothetical protein